MEGNLCFKIDWASLIVGRKFTIFALFCFVLLCIWGQFPSTSPWGAYICSGNLKEGFLHYEFEELIFGGLIHGGAYFRNFTVLIFIHCFNPLSPNSDQDQFSPNGVHTLSRDKFWELIKWSPKRKYFDLFSNSLNLLFKEMYIDISLENLLVDRYWG